MLTMLTLLSKIAVQRWQLRWTLLLGQCTDSLESRVLQAMAQPHQTRRSWNPLVTSKSSLTNLCTAHQLEHAHF